MEKLYATVTNEKDKQKVPGKSGTSQVYSNAIKKRAGCQLICLHERKRAAKTTPKMAEKPDTARALASPVEVAEGLPPLDVPVLPVGLELAPEPVTVAPPVMDAALLPVGRPANNAAEECVTQLDDEGMRAVNGIDAIGPRDSGG